MSDDLFDPSDFYMFPPVFFQFSRFTKQRTTNTQQPNSDFLMDLFYFVLKYGRFWKRKCPIIVWSKMNLLTQ